MTGTKIQETTPRTRGVKTVVHVSHKVEYKKDHAKAGAGMNAPVQK